MLAVYRIIAAAARWLAYAGLAGLAAATAVTLADIVLRALTRTVNPLTAEPIGLAVPGVVDLVQLFVMAAAFAAMPFAFLSDGHVTVDFVVSLLPERVREALRALAALLSTAFMALTLSATWDRAMEVMSYGDTSSTIEIPMIWYWAPLLGGCGASVVAAGAVTLTAAARAAGLAAPEPERAT